MNAEPRATRGATAGSKSAFLEVGTYGYTAAPRELQAAKIARQFGVGTELAAAVAALAYGQADTWRARA